jgi:thioredoxin reductase (NADPH)
LSKITGRMLRKSIIVGGGPAGLMCSIYLTRSGISPLVIAGTDPGGQLMHTDVIENFPGFQSISGPDLMIQMMEQAKSSGSAILFETVRRVEKTDNGNFKITLSSEETLMSKTVIVATGAKHKHLFIPGENEFTNRGVSWCATCDGLLYTGKQVAVIGGGNTALMEAQFLSNMVDCVYLIHRRDSFRGSKILQSRVFGNHKIKILWNTVVTSINGDEKVTSITLNGGDILQVEGVFIAIGTEPSSDFVKNMVECDEEGYIIANDTITSCDGIFAAGDIVSGSLKQAVYAAGQGALASHMVEKYLGVR